MALPPSFPSDCALSAWLYSAEDPLERLVMSDNIFAEGMDLLHSPCHLPPSLTPTTFYHAATLFPAPFTANLRELLLSDNYQLHGMHVLSCDTTTSKHWRPMYLPLPSLFPLPLPLCLPVSLSFAFFLYCSLSSPRSRTCTCSDS